MYTGDEILILVMLGNKNYIGIHLYLHGAISLYVFILILECVVESATRIWSNVRNISIYVNYMLIIC